MDFLKIEFKNIGLVYVYDQNSSERYTLENKVLPLPISIVFSIDSHY